MRSADDGATTLGDHHIHTVATAGELVGQDFATEQSLAPICQTGYRSGTTSGHTCRHFIAAAGCRDLSTHQVTLTGGGGQQQTGAGLQQTGSGWQQSPALAGATDTAANITAAAQLAIRRRSENIDSSLLVKFVENQQSFQFCYASQLVQSVRSHLSPTLAPDPRFRTDCG